MEARSDFVLKNGPIYFSNVENPTPIGFRVHADHCNKANNCHGGWLASIMDIQLAVAATSKAQVDPAMIVTVNLSLDYLTPAPLGAWVQGEAEVLRRGHKMIFVQGLLYADDVLVMRGNGLFKLTTINS